MNALAAPLPRDVLLPQAADGLGRGAVLAVLVHLLLVVALAVGVNWRSHTPEGVVAELWSAVPQVAAPRAASPPTPEAVVPPPAPPAPAVQAPTPPVPPARPVPVEPPPVADPQIAIEKSRREEAKRQALQQEEARRKDEREARRLEAKKLEAQKLEAQKLEAQKLELAKQEAAKQKAQRDKLTAEAARKEEQRRQQVAKEAEARKAKELAEEERREEAALLAQREAYLKRMQGQAGATGGANSTGTAARSSGPSAGYAGRIKARIMPNIIFTESMSGNPLAMVEVRLAPDGTIVSRRLVKGSGSAAWDDAVLRAIDRTEMLPRDTDGRVPPVMQIEFRPRD